MILTFIIFPLNYTYRAFQIDFCFEDIKYIRKTALVSINANSKIVMDLDKTHILLLFVSTRMKNLRTTTSKRLPRIRCIETFITFKEIPRDLDTCDIQRHLIDYVCYIKKNNNCRFHLSIYCLAILPVCLCTIAIEENKAVVYI
jgi:hypothetical protein